MSNSSIVLSLNTLYELLKSALNEDGELANNAAVGLATIYLYEQLRLTCEIDTGRKFKDSTQACEAIVNQYRVRRIFIEDLILLRDNFQNKPNEFAQTIFKTADVISKYRDDFIKLVSLLYNKAKEQETVVISLAMKKESFTKVFFSFANGLLKCKQNLQRHNKSQLQRVVVGMTVF